MAAMSASTHSSIRRARPLLGTFVEIAVTGASEPAMEAAVEAAFAAITRVHRLMSFHQPDSDVGRLNRSSAQVVRVDDWTYEVLEAAVSLHRRSAGLFDVTVAPLPLGLGLPPCTRDDRRTPPFEVGLHDTIHLLPGNQLRLSHAGVQIDLGGVAKGYAVDRAIAVLQQCGMTRGLVNAGGDLATFGLRAEAVDIRDPRQPERTLCRIELSNTALASSAGRFDPMRSAHPAGSAVIDPATAMPPRGIIGATVCARRCVFADALTKVVMNAGESAAALLRHYDASALFVSAGGDLVVTADWKNEVHLAA